MQTEGEYKDAVALLKISIDQIDALHRTMEMLRHDTYVSQRLHARWDHDYLSSPEARAHVKQQLGYANENLPVIDDCMGMIAVTRERLQNIYWSKLQEQAEDSD